MTLHDFHDLMQSEKIGPPPVAARWCQVGNLHSPLMVEDMLKDDRTNGR